MFVAIIIVPVNMISICLLASSTGGMADSIPW